MNLHEYQSKKLLSLYGIPIPTGYVFKHWREVEAASSKIGFGPWVVKCQVHAGGRGQSDGVRIVHSKEEIVSFFKKWIGKRIITHQTNLRGQLVNHILIESATEIIQEFYLSAIIDRSTCRVVFLASSKGGVDIEKVAKETPHLVYRVVIDPLTGPQPYQGRELAFNLGLQYDQMIDFSRIFMKLATLFFDMDLYLAEMNPLVVTNTGKFMCLDSKLSTDSNALFRQSEMIKLYDPSQQDEREIYAARCNLHYITLDGNIGCMVNGAGLAMGMMDIIKLYGGYPANFLDVGGTTTKERITDALKIIVSDDKVEAILVNIFGGIVRCDLIAEGIIVGISEIGMKIPVVVRLVGNNAELGNKLLIDSGIGIIAITDLLSAVKKVISLVQVHY